MRFPHNAKIFRGQFDMAPFMGVFFLLLIFVLIASSLVFTPGVPIQLPVGENVPGIEGPSTAVAVDADGLIYFENQIIHPENLKVRLQRRVERSPEPLILVIQADRSARYERLVELALLAREVGIQDVLLATRPALVPRQAAPAP